MKTFVRCAAIAAISLTACAEEKPLPADKVRDEASAVAIASEACAAEGFRGGHWRARLKHGVWEATLEAPGRCNITSTTVRASDGEVSACTVCVTVH